MKKLISIAFLALLTLSANASGHIHFQRHSTWVSPNNRSLCLDGDMYRASVMTCIGTRTGRDGDNCSQWGKKTITQPVNSTRKVCVDEQPRSGECYRYETVAYTQSPVRKVCVDENPRSGDCYRYGTVTIPACN